MSWLLQLIHVYRPTLLLVRIIIMLMLEYCIDVLFPWQVSLVNAFLIIGCFWEVNRSMNFDEIIHENVLKCFLFLFETRTNGTSSYPCTHEISLGYPCTQNITQKFMNFSRQLVFEYGHNVTNV
eukprot:551353_1